MHIFLKVSTQENYALLRVDNFTYLACSSWFFSALPEVQNKVVNNMSPAGIDVAIGSVRVSEHFWPDISLFPTLCTATEAVIFSPV